jgi:hypothetical protein
MQKFKNRNTAWSSIPLLSIHPKEMKSVSERVICNPGFITVLFTIAKIWEQPKCLSMNEWIKKMWSVSTMEYYSTIKRRNPTNMNETGECYINQHKPDRGGQILYDLI